MVAQRSSPALSCPVNLMIQAPRLFQCLRNPTFARLYTAQTINLVGDALTWLGLALLAFELAGENAGLILSGALTLRVAAYVVLSPLAGAIADRVDRKRIMVITHLARMVIVCLLPFVTQIWHIYAIVLALNLFSAFFYTHLHCHHSLDCHPRGVPHCDRSFQCHLSAIGCARPRFSR